MPRASMACSRRSVKCRPRCRRGDGAPRTVRTRSGSHHGRARLRRGGDRAAAAWRRGVAAPRQAPPRPGRRPSSPRGRPAPPPWLKKSRAKRTVSPRPEPLRRLGERQPAVVAQASVQGELDPRLAPRARKARRDHPRVVKDHHVARPQQGREVCDAAVGEAGGQVQQARGIARARGARRDRPRAEGRNRRRRPAPMAAGVAGLREAASRTARRGAGR